MQLADSADNIAAGALISINLLSYSYFQIFSSGFREILKGKGLLKGLLSAFVSALRGIKLLFAICKRGIEHRVQNWEKSAK